MIRKALTNAMLFYPGRGQSRTPDQLGMEYEEIWLTAEDGVRTQGWWIPGSGRDAVVVMFHGNAGTMADRLDNARLIHELGVALLMAEYRGYGDSDGRPTENGLYADAVAAVNEARVRAGGRKLVVFGRSLGGAVAIDVASKVEVDGLIVESTFTSLPDMARATVRIPGVGYLLAYDFDSASKIERVVAPILIIHGDRDELVPFRMGEKLRDRARNATFHRVPRGSHNDTLILGGRAYWDAWRSFLDAL